MPDMLGLCSPAGKLALAGVTPATSAKLRHPESTALPVRPAELEHPRRRLEQDLALPSHAAAAPADLHDQPLEGQVGHEPDEAQPSQGEQTFPSVLAPLFGK